MKRIMSLIVGVILVFSMSGCISGMVYNQSKQKVALRKAIVSNNTQAINAIKLGDDGVGIGINVLTWEALKEQPLKQFGAAIADALIMWGGYEGVRSLNDSNSGGGNNQDSGRDANQITVNGDNNNVHVGEETTTTNGQ